MGGYRRSVCHAGYVAIFGNLHVPSMTSLGTCIGYEYMSNNNLSLTNQSISLFVGRLLGFAAQMGSSVILVRLISKKDFGIYQQFLLITTTIVPMLSVGLNSSLFYFVPNLSGGKERYIIKQTFAIQLIMGAAFFLLCAVCGVIDFNWFNLGALNSYKGVVSVFVVFMLLSTIVDNIFTLDKNVFLNRYYFFTEKIIRLILLVGFVVFGQSSAAILYALVLFSFLRLIFILYYLGERIFSDLSFDKDLFFAQIKYCLPFAGSIILSTLSKKIDKFVVSGYIGVEDYAIYALAFVSIPVLSEIFRSIQNVVMPEFSRCGIANDIAKAADLWKKVVSKTASVAIPTVLFFFIMADVVIEILYTTEYIGAAKYFRVYILIFLFTMFSHGLVIRGFNKTRLLFIGDLLGAIVTVCISFYLISMFHVYGAIITALISVALPIVIIVNLERKLLQISFSRLFSWHDLGKITLISVASSIFPVIFKEVIANIYICFFASAITYFVAIVLIEDKCKLFIYPRFVATLITKTKLFYQH